jgi:hypothetical protein
MGVDPGFCSLPHRINLKLDFVSGRAIVGIRSMLPVEYSSLLFGIDYAGVKAIMDPIVCEEQVTKKMN